jgi:hypothetical protein
MISTGKRARIASGLNRHGLHRVHHAIKSAAKIRRAGWVGKRQSRTP